MNERRKGYTVRSSVIQPPQTKMGLSSDTSDVLRFLHLVLSSHRSSGHWIKDLTYNLSRRVSCRLTLHNHKSTTRRETVPPRRGKEGFL